MALKKQNSESQSKSKKSLSSHVKKAMKKYYQDLNSVEPNGVYDFVMCEVEPELLIATMRFAKNNQSKAAKYLGLNRATLRKKLLKYKIHSDL